MLKNCFLKIAVAFDPYRDLSAKVVFVLRESILEARIQENGKTVYTNTLYIIQIKNFWDVLLIFNAEELSLKNIQKLTFNRMKFLYLNFF